MRLRPARLSFAFALAMRVRIHLALCRAVELCRLHIALGFASSQIAASGAVDASFGLAIALARRLELGRASQLELGRLAMGGATAFDLYLTHGVGFDVDVAAIRKRRRARGPAP